jgi:hypothetical protein
MTTEQRVCPACDADLSDVAAAAEEAPELPHEPIVCPVCGTLVEQDERGGYRRATEV